MPDLSLCVNFRCPSRTKCYRYRAAPSFWQSYMDFKPEGDQCESFMEIWANARIQDTDVADAAMKRFEQIDVEMSGADVIVDVVTR